MTKEYEYQIDRGHKHTNTSMRQLLGEAGYLKFNVAVRETKEEIITFWKRGSDLIELHESTINAVPYLTEGKSGNVINPKSLGVRNPNLQSGEKP